MSIQVNNYPNTFVKAQNAADTKSHVEAYQSFFNHKIFYKLKVMSFFSTAFSSSKQFLAKQSEATNLAPCGHQVWHPNPPGCGRCGVLWCPMKCRCME